MRKIFETPHDWVLTLVRLLLALVIFPHGAQKALGLFGGSGFGATVSQMSGMMHVPGFVIMLVIAAEFVGSLMLAVGFLGRFAALSTMLVMLGAVFMVHLPNGFFMNWSGQQGGEGFEYHLLFIGLALVTLFKGSGAWSFDRWVAKGWQPRTVESTHLSGRAIPTP